MGALPEDIVAAKRLIKYGFIDKSAKDKYEKDFDKRSEQVEKGKGDDLVKNADMERMEFRSGKMINTSYPTPIERHVLSLADPNYTLLEKSYMWILGHISRDWKFTKLVKITDSSGSSPTSDIWDVSIGRLGRMQSQAQGIMQTVGQLVKDLFPMIHELRLLDERLELYNRLEKGDKAADIALKGTWTDMVDGGPESGMSVLGLAQKANFLTLPDLFFGTFIDKQENVDSEVDKLEYASSQVKNILKRKLKQYMLWKEKTYHEIKQNRLFSISYLRQHMSAIKLQLSWLKPYMAQIKQLKPNIKFQEGWDIVSGFDNSHHEIEVLCTMKSEDKFKPVILTNFQYVTTPERVGGYSQSVHHSGGMTVTFRTYVWSDDQIKNYQDMRHAEAWDDLEDLDAGFNDAMEVLGEEINKYMVEQGEKITKHKKTMSERIKDLESTIEKMEKEPDKVKNLEKHKRSGEPSMNIYEPFKDVGGALWDVVKMFLPFKDNMFKEMFDFKTKNKEFAEANKDAAMKKAAKGEAARATKAAFVNFRKANGMITW